MARPKGRYTGRAVYEANSHVPAATEPTPRPPNNRATRDQTKALYAAGVDLIDAWAYANHDYERARIEAAILRIECDYPDTPAADVRAAVEADPDLWT